MGLIPYTDSISDFMHSQRRNLWVREPDLHLDCYMRRSERGLDRGELTPCLDIGSVEVDSDHWGRGNFTKFLALVEKAAASEKRAVFIENIQHPWLANALRRRGYADTVTSVPELPSLYRKSQ